MFNIGGISFDKYYIKSVELELDSCDVNIFVIFHKEDNRIKRQRHYKVKTNCDVNINELEQNIQQIIKDGEGILKETI